jgi:hypothetical protein
MQRASTVI